MTGAASLGFTTAVPAGAASCSASRESADPLPQRHPQLWAKLLDMDRRAIEQLEQTAPGAVQKEDWTVEVLEKRFAAEEQRQDPCVQGGSTAVKNSKNDPAEEVKQLLKGTPPQNILISLTGNRRRPWEEHAKRLENQKRKKTE